MNRLARYAGSIGVGTLLAYGALHTLTGCQGAVGLVKGTVRDVNAIVGYIKEPLYNDISARKDRQREELEAIERADKERLSELEQQDDSEDAKK